MISRIVFAVVAFFPVLAAFGDAPPDLAKLFPKDTLVFGTRAGADAAGKMAEGTTFGEFLADPEVQHFTSSVRTALDSWMHSEVLNGRMPADAYEGGRRLGNALWRYPMAVGVIDFDLTPVGPDIDLALVCRVGEDAPKLAKDMKQWLNLTGAPVEPVTFAGHDLLEIKQREAMNQVRVGAVGDYLVVLCGDRSAEVVQRIDSGGANLSEDETLAACRKRIGGGDDTRSMSMFVNAKPLMSKIKALTMKMAGPDLKDAKSILRVLDALGLENLAGVCWEMHYRAGGCCNTVYFHTPGGGKGIFSPSSKHLTDDDLMIIPKNANWAGATCVDLAGAYRTAIAQLKSLSPDVDGPVSGIETMAAGMLGVRIEEFLDLFGDTFVAYDARDSGGLWMSGMVVMAKCKDAAKARKHIGMCVRNFAGMVGNKVKIEVKSFDHRGHTIEFLNVAGQPVPLAPAWSDRDGWMIFGLYPQMVSSTLDRLDEGDLRENSILANADFLKSREVLGKLGTTMTYADTRDGIRMLYPFALTFGQMGAAMAQGEGVDIDVTALPSLRTLEKYAHSQVGFTQSDENGTLMASYGTMPIGLTSVAPTSTLASATAISVLLPSLSRARDLSKRTVCAANLRGIGQAMYIHAQDDGKFPPDFKTMLDEQNITRKQLICPSTTHMPSDPLDSCYVIVPGQSTYDNPSNVLVYERPENHDGEGVNVLFQDGHVQFLKMREFRRRLDETKKRLEKKGQAKTGL